MNGERDKQIEAIQSSGYKAAVVVTGGGSGAVHALLSHPGASRFVLDIQIPYSAEALAAYLGGTVVRACSEETVRLLAQVALARASRFTHPASEAIGIACTSALQTNRERKGSDRAYICIKSTEKEVLHKLELEPGSRGRQDAVVSDMLLGLTAGFIGVGG
ncbi:MAG: hypothetical protein ABFR47_09530 [Verrucomicrobiota bacterium]